MLILLKIAVFFYRFYKEPFKVCLKVDAAAQHHLQNQFCLLANTIS